MQNHQFNLAVGESIVVDDYKVTLLEVEGIEAVFEIEGPDGSVVVEPATLNTEHVVIEDEQPVLV